MGTFGRRGAVPRRRAAAAGAIGAFALLIAGCIDGPTPDPDPGARSPVDGGSAGPESGAGGGETRPDPNVDGGRTGSDSSTGRGGDAGPSSGDAARDAAHPPRTDGGPSPLDASPAPACPEPAPPLASCFRGIAFADCGGAAAPALFCTEREGRPDHERCLWFEGGCPAAEYPHPCGGLQCGVVSPFVGYGDRPWTRDRDMNLTLAVETALEAAEPGLDCGPCGVIEGAAPDGWEAGRCFHHLSLCPHEADEAEVPLALRRHPHPADADWSFPSLVAVGLGVTDDFSSRFVQLELDFERGTARACLIQASDDAVTNEPVCADSGRVVVDRCPADPAEVAEMRGHFESRFPPFTPFIDTEPFVTDLVIRGTF